MRGQLEVRRERVGRVLVVSLMERGAGLVVQSRAGARIDKSG